MFAEFDKDIAKNFDLKCRYIMFMDYRTIELNRIDHRLDLKLTAKVNEFINVSFVVLLCTSMIRIKTFKLAKRCR